MADKVQIPDDVVLLDALMENMADSIYFKDRRCRLLKVSRKMANDFGCKDTADLIGKTDRELFGEEFGKRTMVDDLRVIETGVPIVGMIESRDMPNGDINWTSTSKLPLRNREGEIIGMVGITREVNDLKQAEFNLQYLATHDMLTKLPNRYLLFDRLEQSISRAERQKTLFAVLYIDLDEFKKVNDRCGHDIGDQVLKLSAERIMRSVRKSDTVARMGGDEFVIILEEVKSSENALCIAGKVQKNLGQSFGIINYPLPMTASIGISLYPEHGMDGSTLLKAADHAMYVAKKKHNYCMLFTFPKQSNDN